MASRRRRCLSPSVGVRRPAIPARIQLPHLAPARDGAAPDRSSAAKIPGPSLSPSAGSRAPDPRCSGDEARLLGALEFQVQKWCASCIARYDGSSLAAFGLHRRLPGGVTEDFGNPEDHEADRATPGFDGSFRLLDTATLSRRRHPWAADLEDPGGAGDQKLALALPACKAHRRRSTRPTARPPCGRHGAAHPGSRRRVKNAEARDEWAAAGNSRVVLHPAPPARRPGLVGQFVEVRITAAPAAARAAKSSPRNP